MEFVLNPCEHDLDIPHMRELNLFKNTATQISLETIYPKLGILNQGYTVRSAQPLGLFLLFYFLSGKNPIRTKCPDCQVRTIARSPRFLTAADNLMPTRGAFNYPSFIQSIAASVIAFYAPKSFGPA
jgi:hypothetical protein